MTDRTDASRISPAAAGLRGKCPRCGDGQLFTGFLTLRSNCDHCGLNYDFADSGDGPAAFVILITGFIVVGLALWMEVTTNAPLWLHLVLWVPLTIILALAALRLIKGLLITYQYANKAAEGRLENRE
ncbi:DUF983 domain-containing protein [Nitratireductor sp. CH_MIT9313-5]|uniref:DUF983 domain-containing protein n=1 Tax=Nitratireductor sp. CH_MIT9313-5 TaxID=3107764 RepID=UPI00300AD565